MNHCAHRIAASIPAILLSVSSAAAPTLGIAPTPQREIDRVEIVAPVQAQYPDDGRPVLVPATVDYEWIFRVPVVSMETRRVTVTAPDLTSVWKRWDYEAPALRSKRIKLWDAPEFSCKYADLTLPNECRTVWHGVYADVPVLVSERVHLDVDVPRVLSRERSIGIEVVRWTWKEKRFRFSLPAVAPAGSVDQVRSSLNDQRSFVANASDRAISAIDRDIETVEASGGDPSRLLLEDDSAIDLRAQRQSLLEERASELERLAALDAELSRLRP